jgi:heme O synthase-like polyprenyltransferase
MNISGTGCLHRSGQDTLDEWADAEIPDFITAQDRFMRRTEQRTCENGTIDESEQLVGAFDQGELVCPRLVYLRKKGGAYRVPGLSS